MRRAIIIWSVSSLVLHGLLPSAKASSSPPYSLSQHQVREGRVILRLINERTGELVWKRTVVEVNRVGWAQDRKALGLAIFAPGSNVNFQLLIWRENKPVRLIAGGLRHHGWGFEGYENDGVLDFAWSPDDRRVLFRPWGSGGKDLNVGSLYCLDVNNWRLSWLPKGVRRMQWQGNRRVKYRVMKSWSRGNTYGEVEDARPRFWNLP